MMNYEPQVCDILDRLDSLETLYRDGYVDTTDIKLLQGIERCIELRMKILGYDGKTQIAAPISPESIVSIDLKQLSEQTLREIIELSTTER